MTMQHKLLAAVGATLLAILSACAQQKAPAPPQPGTCGASGNTGGASGGAYALQGPGYWADIKTLFVARCQSCHAVGSNRDYTDYEKAKAAINGIITAIDRAPGERGFMPERGQKLSLADREKFI